MKCFHEYISLIEHSNFNDSSVCATNFDKFIPHMMINDQKISIYIKLLIKECMSSKRNRLKNKMKAEND